MLTSRTRCQLELRNCRISTPSAGYGQNRSTHNSNNNNNNNNNSRNLPGHQTQTNDDYMNQKLRYTNESLIDGSNDGVMMSWETPIMQKHVSDLLEGLEINPTEQKEIRILNIGFGMGIVDNFFQEGIKQVCEQYEQAGFPISFKHTVIEGHPDVISRIKDSGKYNHFQNFHLLEGRWQDIIPKIENEKENEKFDIIYFDTYAEYDDDFYQFICSLPKILSKTGKFSFFNGNCPDNIFFHGVACEIIRLQLAENDLKVEFTPMEIDASDDPAWEEVKRKYWFRSTYYIPNVYY